MFKVGDRVRALRTVTFETAGVVLPAGALGTVVNGHERMYPGKEGPEYDRARTLAKIIFPVTVHWDEQPLDELGHDFIPHSEDEIEAA